MTGTASATLIPRFSSSQVISSICKLARFLVPPLALQLLNIGAYPSPDIRKGQEQFFLHNDDARMCPRIGCSAKSPRQCLCSTAFTTFTQYRRRCIARHPRRSTLFAFQLRLLHASVCRWQCRRLAPASNDDSVIWLSSQLAGGTCDMMLFIF